MEEYKVIADFEHSACAAFDTDSEEYTLEQKVREQAGGRKEKLLVQRMRSLVVDGIKYVRLPEIA